jgi:hypothetical protein
MNNCQSARQKRTVVLGYGSLSWALVEGFLSGCVISGVHDFDDLGRDSSHHDLDPLAQGHL